MTSLDDLIVADEEGQKWIALWNRSPLMQKCCPDFGEHMQMRQRQVKRAIKRKRKQARAFDAT